MGSYEARHGGRTPADDGNAAARRETAAKVRGIGTDDAVWLVTDAGPVSELEDVCHKTTLRDLELIIRGYDRGGELLADRNPRLHTNKREALADARGRLYRRDREAGGVEHAAPSWSA